MTRWRNDIPTHPFQQEMKEKYPVPEKMQVNSERCDNLRRFDQPKPETENQKTKTFSLAKGGIKGDKVIVQ